MTATGYALDVSREELPEVAKWVRAVRLAAGLSQDAFGEKIDPEKPIHRTTVNRWEAGTLGLRFDKIRLICQAFPDCDPPPVAGHTQARGNVEPATSNQGECLHSREGRTVADEIDGIEDEGLRRRARTAALAAIDEVRATDPTQPRAGTRQGRARGHT